MQCCIITVDENFYIAQIKFLISKFKFSHFLKDIARKAYQSGIGCSNCDKVEKFRNPGVSCGGIALGDTFSESIAHHSHLHVAPILLHLNNQGPYNQSLIS